MFIFGNYNPHHETCYSILPNDRNSKQLDSQIDESNFAAINENLSNRMFKLPVNISELTLRPYPHLNQNREAKRFITKSTGVVINAFEGFLFNLPSSLCL